MEKPINILIVDDSAVVRQTLKEVLSDMADIRVMGAASDPFAAVEKIRQEVPDVILLDVEMPRMDGLTFLEKLMRQYPIPVVICSSLVGDGSETAFRALEYGAVEVIQKPKVGSRKFFEESRVLIADAIRAAAQSRLKKPAVQRRLAVPAKLTADVMLPKPTGQAMVETTDKVVVVGASTGGTEALRVFLEMLPLDAPGVVVVQHMPEQFTAAFSKRLDGICAINVREAQNNDTVMQGHALIARGNSHLMLKRSGARYYVELRDGPLVSRHRPSVDVLFRSAARYCGANALGVIMTGMGDDGAKGMLEMKEAGAYTIAQDEATCVVFGMPGEAIKLGAIDQVLPLQSIPDAVIRWHINGGKGR